MPQGPAQGFESHLLVSSQIPPDDRMAEPRPCPLWARGGVSRPIFLPLLSPIPSKHAPGVPRILVGNRLHLAFKRQVPTEQARAYAEKNCMTFFEVSPLCNFNVVESFTELSRIVLMRHGMEKIWRPNRGAWALGGGAGGLFPLPWSPCSCGSL